MTRRQAKRKINNEIETLVSNQPDFDKILDEVFDGLEERVVRKFRRAWSSQQVSPPEPQLNLYPGAPTSLTVDQLAVACRNIGYDLACAACAATFFTGATTCRHDSTCRTRRLDGSWTHCGRRLDDLDNYCPVCGTSGSFAQVVDESSRTAEGAVPGDPHEGGG